MWPPGAWRSTRPPAPGSKAGRMLYPMASTRSNCASACSSARLSLVKRASRPECHLLDLGVIATKAGSVSNVWISAMAGSSARHSVMCPNEQPTSTAARAVREGSGRRCEKSAACRLEREIQRRAPAPSLDQQTDDPLAVGRRVHAVDGEHAGRRHPQAVIDSAHARSYNSGSQFRNAEVGRSSSPGTRRSHGEDVARLAGGSIHKRNVGLREKLAARRGEVPEQVDALQVLEMAEAPDGVVTLQFLLCERGLPQDGSTASRRFALVSSSVALGISAGSSSTKPTCPSDTFLNTAVSSRLTVSPFLKLYRDASPNQMSQDRYTHAFTATARIMWPNSRARRRCRGSSSTPCAQRRPLGEVVGCETGHRLPRRRRRRGQARQPVRHPSSASAPDRTGETRSPEAVRLDERANCFRLKANW